MGLKKTKHRLETANARILMLEHALEYYAGLPEVVHVPEWRDYVGSYQAKITLELSRRLLQEEVELLGTDENDE